MSESYRMWDTREWQAAWLNILMEKGEMTYINQMEDYADSLAGEWYITDDDTRTIIYGTFGNDHSPGCSSSTYAEVWAEDEVEDYQKALAVWESYPEYVEIDDEGEEVNDWGETDNPFEYDDPSVNPMA